MKRVWTHFFSIFFITLLTSGGIYTNSYFFDTEGSGGNVIASTYLDGQVTGGPLSTQVCADGGSAETEIQFRNSGAFEFFYNMATEDIEGDACGDMQLEVYQNDALIFDGALSDFAISDTELEADSDDVWRVKAKFPAGLGKTGHSCSFSTVFSAQQGEFLSGQAFYDREDLVHTIAVTPAAVCGGASVNLRLTKAISGDSNGFALSDFNYRVTGPDIDTIVPHGGTVALPEGVYTIEELVPEGFVKEDWRIGWYGQCASGDAFSTTITIDDGNIDHGTLYCQADNQYRPELNDSDETAPQSPETQTLEPRRSVGVGRTDRPSREAGGDVSTATSSDGESLPEETDAPKTSTTSSEEIDEPDESNTVEEEVASDAEQGSESDPESETTPKEEEAADPGEVESAPEPEPEPAPEPEPEPVPDEAIDQ